MIELQKRRIKITSKSDTENYWPIFEQLEFEGYVVPFKDDTEEIRTKVRP